MRLRTGDVNGGEDGGAGDIDRCSTRINHSSHSSTCSRHSSRSSNRSNGSSNLKSLNSDRKTRRYSSGNLGGAGPNTVAAVAEFSVGKAEYAVVDLSVGAAVVLRHDRSTSLCLMAKSDVTGPVILTKNVQRTSSTGRITVVLSR